MNAYDVKLKCFIRRAERIIDGIFTSAFLSGNDCNFWLALLNPDPRGIIAYHVLQSEDMEFFISLTNLMNTDMPESTQIRLKLMTYCHLYENSTLPKLFRNLFMVINNQAPSMLDFKYQKNGLEQSPEWKYKSVFKIANNQEFKDLINEVFVGDIRHAFSHSDYVLTDREMVLSPERNVISQYLDIDDVLLTINKMFCFYEIAMKIWYKYQTEIYLDGDYIKGTPNLGFTNIKIINKNGRLGFETGDGPIDMAQGQYLILREKKKPIFRVRIRIQIAYVYNRPSFFDIKPFFVIEPKFLMTPEIHNCANGMIFTYNLN